MKDLQSPGQAIKRYARAKQAAKYLNIAVSTIWHWTSTRPDFPRPLRAGPKTTLFDLDQIDAWLANRSAK